MARAVIPDFVQNFGQPDVSDDTTNGWKARFQVFYTGTGAVDGFMVDTFEAHFLDAENAANMDDKMRDGARIRAGELGIPNSTSMNVISFIVPRRL